MASTALTYPATTGNISNGGASIGWTSTGNAVDGSDATAAQCDVIDYDVAKFLALTNLGFAIPSDATINGVEVEVLHKADNAAYFNISRGPWKLIYSGAVVGTDQAGTGALTNSPARITVGSSSNLWGVALTPAIVNSSSFGVGLSYVCSDVYSGSIIYVYSARIKVYYTEAGTSLRREVIQYA